MYGDVWKRYLKGSLKFYSGIEREREREVIRCECVQTGRNNYDKKCEKTGGGRDTEREHKYK